MCLSDLHSANGLSRTVAAGVGAAPSANILVGMSILWLELKYANLIVDGKKTWELFGLMRQSDLARWEARGRILISELVSSKPKWPECVIGAVTVTGCVHITEDAFNVGTDKHCAPDFEPAKAWLEQGRCYAAVLVDAQRFDSPVPFQQMSGGKWLKFREPSKLT